MTQADLDSILEARRPVPMIMLQCGGGRSPQERANDAWKALGEKMGFDHMTVQPTGQGDRFFSAVPSETPGHKAEREAREQIERTQAEIAKLEQEISERQQRLTALRQ